MSAVETLKARAQAMRSGFEAELSVVIEVFVPAAVVGAVAKVFATQFPLTPLRLFIEGSGRPTSRCWTAVAASASWRCCRWFPSLASEPLGSVPLITVAAPHHPLAGIGRRIARRELAKHVQRVLTDRSDQLAGCDYGVVSPTAWRLADLSTKHAFLKDGVGGAACRCPWSSPTTRPARSSCSTWTAVPRPGWP